MSLIFKKRRCNECINSCHFYPTTFCIQLVLGEVHILFVYSTTVPKRDEVMGQWKKLHSGELRNLYASPDIIRQTKSRRMRWAGHVARMGEGRNVYRILMGKPERKTTWKTKA
jgi:hypothetical protein